MNTSLIWALKLFFEVQEQEKQEPVNNDYSIKCGFLDRNLVH